MDNQTELQNQSTFEEAIGEAEAARILGLAPGTIRRWRCEGQGPSWFKLGGAVRYHRSAVEFWMRAQCVDPSAPVVDTTAQR